MATTGVWGHDTSSEGKEERTGEIIAFPILNGLHHDTGARRESLEANGTNAYRVVV